MAAERGKWSGTLMLIGQPAEERIGGALAMMKDGLYKRFGKPDFALGVHVKADMATGKVHASEVSPYSGADTVEIAIKGVGAHGAQPHRGKDPIVLGAMIVMGLQTIVSREVKPGDPAVVTVGSIHGGTKGNIISDEVRLQLTVRSYKTETRQHLIDSIKRIVQAQAESANMPADKMPEVIVSDDHARALYNQPALCADVRQMIGAAIGADNVLTREPVMGAEDFSEYGMTKDKVPLCMFWLGTQPPNVVAEAKAKGVTLPSLHSTYFKPIPEPSIETGVKAMTSAVIGLMKK